MTKPKTTTYTCLGLLKQMEKAGIKLWGTLEEANFDAENDTPQPLGTVLTPEEVDSILATFGKTLPWDATREEQEQYFGGQIMNTVTVLATLLEYYKQRDSLPLQDSWWGIRCSDPYSSGSSLSVNLSPEHGVYVFYVRSARPDVCAFPEEYKELGTGDISPVKNLGVDGTLARIELKIDRLSQHLGVENEKD